MTNEVKSPGQETRARSVEKMRSLCKRIDSNLLELDELIASLEADNRKSPLIAYRLGKINLNRRCLLKRIEGEKVLFNLSPIFREYLRKKS